MAISDRRTDPKSYFAKTRGRHVIHPEKGRFGQTPIYNFALIRLQKPIDFSKYPHIKPACLPSLEGVITYYVTVILVIISTRFQEVMPENQELLEDTEKPLSRDILHTTRG